MKIRRFKFKNLTSFPMLFSGFHYAAIDDHVRSFKFNIKRTLLSADVFSLGQYLNKFGVFTSVCFCLLYDFSAFGLHFCGLFLQCHAALLIIFRGPVINAPPTSTVCSGPLSNISTDSPFPVPESCSFVPG